MRNLLYVAVYKHEYGTDAILFYHLATGTKPKPPESGEELAKLAGIKNFCPECGEEIAAALVKNPTFPFDKKECGDQQTVLNMDEAKKVHAEYDPKNHQDHCCSPEDYDRLVEGVDDQFFGTTESHRTQSKPPDKGENGPT